MKMVKIAGAVILMLSCNCFSAAHRAKQNVDDISPTEDLMREHGVLNRLLLVYDHYTHRIRKQLVISVPLLHQTVQLVQSFIENYHEKLEEDYIFPRFERAKKETKLIATLRSQHQKGRTITQRLLEITNPARNFTPGQMRARYHEIKNLLKTFIIMYRPHAAREDTVLFPQLRTLMTDEEFTQLGELFEQQEHTLFGKKGFERIVQRVATIEQNLEIYDLEQFTPEA